LDRQVIATFSSYSNDTIIRTFLKAVSIELAETCHNIVKDARVFLNHSYVS